MKDFTTPEVQGYAQRTIIPRDLFFVQPHNIGGSSLTDFGFWNGIGSVALDTKDGLTGSTVTRTFTGKGGLLDISDIPISDSLKVISVQVHLSQLEANVQNALRGYDMRYAPCQIFRALFDINNQRTIIAPARCRFVGYVNKCVLITPKENSAASAQLDLVGCTNELTRTNTDIRSDESQRKRDATDSFFKYVNATGQVEVFWGQGKSTDTSDTPTTTIGQINRKVYS